MKKIAMLLSSVLLVTALVAPSFAGVALPGLDPAYVMSLHSLNSNTGATILVTNSTSWAVDVVWIDGGGSQVLIGTLPPGTVNAQLNTWLTHPFVARRNSDAHPIVGFMAQTANPDHDTFTITEQPVPVQSTTWGGIKALQND